MELLRERGDSRNLNEFFKIPPSYRVKKTESFLEKALHRKKKYTDPLVEITDKVGARFVVLLGSEIPVVVDAIHACDVWTSTKDRDYVVTRQESPSLFDYESVHFTLRSNGCISIEGMEIPGDLACEVQVRTLLQHAYAELSHDRVYKPDVSVPDDVRRQVARGSALLETTDEVFEQVSSKLAKALSTRNELHRAAVIASEKAGVTMSSRDPKLTFSLIDAFAAMFEGANQETLSEFVARRDWLADRMKKRSRDGMLFEHPAGVLAYWLVDQFEHDAIPKWPFRSDLLESIFSDLSISIHGDA